MKLNANRAQELQSLTRPLCETPLRSFKEATEEATALQIFDRVDQAFYHGANTIASLDEAYADRCKPHPGRVIVSDANRIHSMQADAVELRFDPSTGEVERFEFRSTDGQIYSVENDGELATYARLSGDQVVTQFQVNSQGTISEFREYST